MDLHESLNTFTKILKYEDLVLLNTGETLLKSQLPKELPEGIEIVKKSDQLKFKRLTGWN